MISSFTPWHRGGAGTPLVCLHGFLDTWRTWELVIPALERHHDVLAPTLAGHSGGPPIEGELTDATLLDAIEDAMDAAGFARAHLVGNSLGGYTALRLAARGRAQSVVALAPAGGWAPGDDGFRELLGLQLRLYEMAKVAAPHAGSLLASDGGRRRATELLTVNYEHIPVELLAHQLLGVASCPDARRMIEYGQGAQWTLDAEHVECPVRVVWGAADRLLPWPGAAMRYRRDWLPQADWVLLDDVGHAPQLDVPLETAQLILGLTAG